MRKFALMFGAMLIVLLGGCQVDSNPIEYTFTLLNSDGSVYESVTTTGKVYDLPMLDDSEKVFAGWTDGESYFYGEFEVKENTELTASFEEYADVFMYTTNDNSISITGYRGNARILRIPSVIDDAYVTSIGIEAFRDSDLEKVYIPNTVSNVNYRAFAYSKDLIYVEFYGTNLGTADAIYPEDEFNDLIDNSACEVSLVGVGDQVSYQSGCPIKDVKSITSTTIAGTTFKNYEVTVDLEFMPTFTPQLIFTDAFMGCESLEGIVFPQNIQLFDPTAFNYTPKLTDISTNQYKVIEGVLFSEDEKTLMMYPGGLISESYSIPEGTTQVLTEAFNGNEYITSITIPDSLSVVNGRAFGNTPNLTSFIVKDSNEDYYTTNGILFEKDNDGDVLVSYPNGLSDTSFTIPSSVIEIGSGAFSYNATLEEVIIPDGVTYIGEYAFGFTGVISKIDIPKSVTHVNLNFNYRSNIDTIIIRRSGILDGSISLIRELHPNSGLVKIYVPDDSVTQYKEHLGLRAFKDNIYPISEYTE